MVRRLAALAELTQAPAVDDEDIQPAVVVVVEQSDAAARCREKKIFRFVPLDHGFPGQSGAFCDIHVIGKIAGGLSRGGTPGEQTPEGKEKAARGLAEPFQRLSPIHGLDYTG